MLVVVIVWMVLRDKIQRRYTIWVGTGKPHMLSGQGKLRFTGFTKNSALFPQQSVSLSVKGRDT